MSEKGRERGSATQDKERDKWRRWGEREREMKKERLFSLSPAARESLALWALRQRGP